MNIIKHSLVSLLILLSAQLMIPIPANAQQKKASDAWYLRPKSNFDWNELKPQISYRVKSAFISAYINDLKTVRFKKIGWAEAQMIVGNGMETPKGYFPYVMRGLMLNDGAGRFRILQKAGSIWVFHGGMGSSNSWIKQPVVVILRKPPTQVYTTASTAS